MTRNQQCQIHRFRDDVAICFDGTDTIYLSPEQARVVADKLQLYAADVKADKFSESPLGTTVIKGEAHGDVATFYNSRLTTNEWGRDECTNSTCTQPDSTTEARSCAEGSKTCEQ